LMMNNINKILAQAVEKDYKWWLKGNINKRDVF
jgi:hypothetical protein